MSAHPFTLRLLDWYATHRREMPWRRTREPYAVWLSEVILQQTRVQQGWSYWERFMEAFPTVEALAAAQIDDILRLWQGLGYYSRARHLHEAARQVVALGAFPSSREGWLRLSGVGPYTAAAVASLTCNEDCAALDGNAFRLLARHFGIGLPIGSSEAKRTFEALAKELLPPGHARDFNLAVMDFGSLQCTPQSPLCTACPMGDTCVALHEGRVGELPARGRKVAVQERRMTYVYIRHNGHVALRQRGAGDIWQGLWELVPLTSLTDKAPHMILIAKAVKHQLTHRTLLVDLYLWEPAARPLLQGDYRWVDETALDRYAHPRLFDKLFALLPPPTQPIATPS